MIVKRTHNKNEIESIIYHDKIIHLSTENGIKTEINTDKVCWIGTYINNKIVGLFAFEPLNKVSLDGHCYFLPEHRKNISSESYKLTLKLIFDLYDYKKIIVKCSSKDWHVKNFCLNSGFKLEGKTEKSALHKDRLVDEYILGMTKEQFLEYINV